MAAVLEKSWACTLGSVTFTGKSKGKIIVITSSSTAVVETPNLTKTPSISFSDVFSPPLLRRSGAAPEAAGTEQEKGGIGTN